MNKSFLMGTMRNALIVLWLLSSFLISTLALAQDNTPPIADAGPDETVFVGQMVFIGEWTSYEIPKTVPQLRIVETQLLLCEEYGLGPTICELADLQAFFDPEVDEIVTYRDCFREKIECESHLFHETIHYVQDYNGLYEDDTFDRESLEEEAEELEIEWRYSHGLPKWEVSWKKKLRENTE